jgi:hypothetical protein
MQKFAVISNIRHIVVQVGLLGLMGLMLWVNRRSTMLTKSGPLQGAKAQVITFGVTGKRVLQSILF